jgi:hypothetical protein
VNDTYDAIVIGAGAAGLMCAGVAGRRGRRVLLIEHNRRVGEKILISGGGRCNFTNRDARPEAYQSANLHFVRSALARYPAQSFIDLVERHRIPWYEKTRGQLFCKGDRSARRIVDMLLAECAAGDVTVKTGVEVTDVARGAHFRVATSGGDVEAPALVIATGGLSIPKLGASDFAYRLARQFDLPVVATAPALVPLAFGEDDLFWMRPLAGVSAPAAVTAGGVTFREAALFTHRGLSGPAILQASSYWRPGATVTIDFAPDLDLHAHLLDLKRARPRLAAANALAAILPARLAHALTARVCDPERALADLRDATLGAIAATVRALRVTPAGDEGYAKAEVTRGGVDTRALSSRTMGAAGAPGLFVIGEAADVTGWLGGYNFQWAWASGWCAGTAL